MAETDHRSRLDALPVRDEQAALASTEGDSSLADELLEALLAGLPAEIEDLRACVAESDWAGLSEHAHQMRGATGYCGVPALDEAIQALERAARVGDAERVAECVIGVELQAHRLVDAVASGSIGASR
ncbi:MAG: Hpt domain-containing protein [Thiocapsa sp.]|nr:Hpt domain-containing protein [Thiocapsa sp.]MCG6897056.1 Hpt domain-containing protein [Thiocapsa sp.]